MQVLVRPELPTASVGSSQATTAAVDNSVPLATRPQSTYKSGNVVHTSGATSFVKSIGIYIPGSYVKLANGEVSVVIKRGINAHTPYVASIIGMRGAPNQDPVLRDTSEPGFEIKEGVSANQVRLRTNWEELLNKFFDLYGPST